MLYLLPVKADHLPADTKEAFLLLRLTTNSATLMVTAEIAPTNATTLVLHVEWRIPKVQRGSISGAPWHEIDSPSLTFPT